MNTLNGFHFCIKDNLAYTEDLVCITKLVVTKIPRYTASTEIHEYFSQYGKIRKILYYAIKKRCKKNAFPRKVYITYCKPQAATSVLMEKRHTLRHKIICVMPCDSWEQPNIEFKEYAMERLAHRTRLKALHTLNDDCLLNVFKHIRLCRQGIFASTSKRVQEIFHIYSKVKHKQLDLNQLLTMTVWECHEFLKGIGPFVQSIISAGAFEIPDRVLDFIAEYCTEVIKLDLHNTYIGTVKLRTFLSKMKHLKTVTLRNCSIRDGSLNQLDKLSNLESLNLSDNHITGEYISRAKQIKHLTLNLCKELSTPELLTIFTFLENLETLDLRGSDIFQLVIDSMPETCLKLQTLKISILPSIDFIKLSLIPSLRNLDIFLTEASSYQLKDFFIQLKENKGTQLESLYISADYVIDANNAEYIGKLHALKYLYCAIKVSDYHLNFFTELVNLETLHIADSLNVSNMPLASLISNFPKLKMLNIQNCTRISTFFVKDLYHCLLEHQMYRTEQIMIYAKGTSICSSVLNETYYKTECVRYFKINFENLPMSSTDSEELYRRYI